MASNLVSKQPLPVVASKVHLGRAQYPIALHENGSHAFAKVSLTFEVRPGQNVNPMSTTTDWWNRTHDGLLVNVRRTWVCTMPPSPGTYINWVRPRLYFDAE
ncbi:unnamed protein product [Heligmosomoides polygyrus]|uniref:PepX_C domain-containing protein n=1 Tax=Heligmosomoides polygyrus TaxID=6339 RepID=A0A183GNU5_HELPZ|nr:unnamed protein product [Heligmosomoides polygyrus]